MTAFLAFLLQLDVWVQVASAIIGSAFLLALGHLALASWRTGGSIKAAARELDKFRPGRNEDSGTGRLLAVRGREFWLVGTLQLRRDSTGRLIEYAHAFDDNVQTNAHAAGPFCYFSLPQAPRAEGVYAIYVDGELAYIGECVDLAGRFSSTGYGTISPRNCHRDGQSTNCKLNSRILAGAQKGQTTEIWFHPTTERKQVEAQLISELTPPWNGRARGTGHTRVSEPRSAPAQPRDSVTQSRGGAADKFRAALAHLLEDAARGGHSRLTVKAGELHRIVGGYPGPGHRMPVCCSVMRSAMLASDSVIHQPPKGNGASLLIEYQLPR